MSKQGWKIAEEDIHTVWVSLHWLRINFKEEKVCLVVGKSDGFHLN